MRVCLGCGISIETLPGNAKYCKRGCRQRSTYAKWREQNPVPDIPSGSVGALHELLVCADLMRKGLHVFRAMSPSCPVDLAVLKGKDLVRVEVTTGHRLVSGLLMHPPKDSTRFDVLAIVEHGGNITYEPEIE